MKTTTLAALAALVSVLLLSACTAPGGAAPISAQGAKDIGNDQGSAQATESGSVANSTNPSTVIVFGAKKVTVNTDGSTEVESETPESLELTSANFGNVTISEQTQDARNSSAGGAAGGTGGTARSPGPGLTTTPEEGGDQ